MVGIVILNYNNWQDTINCINSIETYNSALVKIIVVDNGSTNNSVYNLNEYFSNKFKTKYRKLNATELVSDFPYISLVVNNTNEGYARGNNVGLYLIMNDRSITDVLILNNDILLIEDIIPELIKTKRHYNDSAIITPLLLEKDGSTIDITCARSQYTVKQEIIYNFFHYIFPEYVDRKLSVRYILKGYNLGKKIIPIQVPSGACMLIDKSFFESIGFFDPSTFLYWEESILYEKVKQNNKQNYLNANARCIHLGGASTNTNTTSRFCLRCGNHSARYFMRKYSNCGILLYFLFYLSTIFNVVMFEVRNMLIKLKYRK